MSASLRRFLITRILLTIPMIWILITMVLWSCASFLAIQSRSQLGPKGTPEQIEKIRSPARIGQTTHRAIWHFSLENGHL